MNDRPRLKSIFFSNYRLLQFFYLKAKLSHLFTLLTNGIISWEKSLVETFAIPAPAGYIKVESPR